jgi:hypothetical protein
MPIPGEVVHSGFLALEGIREGLFRRHRPLLLPCGAKRDVAQGGGRGDLARLVFRGLGR